jgi:predicted DNA-binding protein
VYGGDGRWCGDRGGWPLVSRSQLIDMQPQRHELSEPERWNLHCYRCGMSDSARLKDSRRRAGRPPAGAREGEKVKDYPQLSVRVPVEMKARLSALSAVTGLAQWRVIVEAIDCFVDDLPPTDRELVNGISERLLRAS